MVPKTKMNKIDYQPSTTEQPSNSIIISMSFKNELIENLQKFSSFLYGKTICEQDQIDLTKSTNQLLIRLTDIKFESDDALNFRNELMIRLATNKTQTSTIDKLSIEERMKQAIENHQLLLRIMYFETSIDNSNESSQIDENMVINQTDSMTIFKSEICSITEDVRENLLNFHDLKEKMLKIFECINGSIILQNSVHTFSWNFKLSSFSESSTQSSSKFVYKGIEWCILAFVSNDWGEDIDSLDISVCSCSSQQYAVTVDCQLTLLGPPNLTEMKPSKRFTNARSTYKYKEVINVSELTRKDSNYVTDGYFTVQARLSNCCDIENY